MFDPYIGYQQTCVTVLCQCSQSSECQSYVTESLKTDLYHMIECYCSLLLFQNVCDLPQIHLLSVKMQANLHHGCPPNCQDLLTWLPANQAARIMSYLDPGNVFYPFLFLFTAHHNCPSNWLNMLTWLPANQAVRLR